jgi:L-amino acid N-acyltransferase YncA
MIHIRPAGEEDLPQMLEIYNEIILNTTAVYEYRPHTLSMRQAWFEAKIRDGYPVFAAAEEEELLGFSSFGPFRAWPAYKYSVENSVYVKSGRRGLGIGRLLLEPLILSAAERDMHAIIASIDADNEASYRLHRSCGFAEVAHFREVGFKFGRWLDLKFLERVLDTPSHPKDD